MIRLIATDMDGTFLDDQKQFDQLTFQRLLAQMEAQRVHFVVASGNQYQHLIDIFGDWQEQLTYIADNGALVMNHGEMLMQKTIPQRSVNQILLLLKKSALLQNGLVVLSGQNGAYIAADAPQDFITEGSRYYRELTPVENLMDVSDAIYKVALAWPGQSTNQQEEFLSQQFSELTVTSSGYEGIDIIPQAISKAVGIQALQQLWQITPAESAAFGDSGNDIEMLKTCDYSYAMTNAATQVRQIANYSTQLDNNHNGVLDTIAQLLVKQLN